MDSTHDPNLASWIESANHPENDFPIQNLPYASFHKRGEERLRVGVRIGDMALDASEALGIESLAAVMKMSRRKRTGLRARISELLTTYSSAAASAILPLTEIELLLPCEIPDYTDFFASLDHATNVGRLFRPDKPLAPNYKWIPIAYHGRASSVVLSGTPVRRPKGQIVDGGSPVYAPTRMLDYELEAGAFIGPGNPLGEPIPISSAEDHLFGVCLLNDWSARDIQSWEYQPLGPFLGKSFATSISPWIVTLDALEPFRASAAERPAGDPAPLPYLRSPGLGAPGPGAFRITLEVWLRTAKMQQPVQLSQSDFGSLYWTFGQMIAHHTSNGCPLRAGDLIGSGTVSGPAKQNEGCLLEITRRGAEPLELPTGESRQFLEDGDEVSLKGWCAASDFRRIGLGECRGLILPALPA